MHRGWKGFLWVSFSLYAGYTSPITTSLWFVMRLSLWPNHKPPYIKSMFWQKMEKASSVHLRDDPASYRSAVWKHFAFRMKDATAATCRICYTDVPYKHGNTSNMNTHLVRKHNIRNVCTCSSPSMASFDHKYCQKITRPDNDIWDIF